jgi:uncharacterized protein
VGDRVRGRWEQLPRDTLEYTESGWIPNYERRVPPPRLQLPLAPEASMRHTQVPAGFELQLFASEPDIANPIALAWDERGRLWIAETVDYPNQVRSPGEPGRDRIKILEDTDGDGRADRFTVFADGLNIPTGLVFANGGVIVPQAPDFLFLRDTTGDDRADVREVILTGWGTFDTHAGPSNLRYGFDNRIWGVVGYSGFRGMVDGDSLSFTQAAYRLRPDGSELEHVASFSNNTWGLGFSETFDVFGSTANNTHAVYVGIPHRFAQGLRGLPPRFGSQKIDGHYEMRPITPNIRQVDVYGGFTSAAGFNLYTARSFPREYWNRVALVSEPTGHLLHKAIVERNGAGYIERDGWNLVASRDEWFSPVDAQVGPDGAVWIADWYNFIIQHNPTPPGFETGPGNAHENPLRDRTHGRIYRLLYRDAPPYRPLDLSRASPAELVRALEHDNLFWRLTAQRLLVERGSPDVLPQLYRLVQNRGVDELGLNPAAIHALWTIHGLGALDGRNRRATSVAVAALRHPVAGVRKAAIEVLPRNPAGLRELLRAGSLEDADPITRKSAVLTLADMTESRDLGERLYRMSTAPEVAQDEWLSDAVYVAAARHRAGFLGAYEAALGAAEYRALAQRFAQEEAAPPAPAQQLTWDQQIQRQQATQPTQRPPVAERLLRAYVEDVVGPIQRQPAEQQRRAAAEAEPPLEIIIGMKVGQMDFDVDEFTVKPGQRVRLTLNNPDEMPHNLLILRPGTTEAVGALADAMMTARDAAERQYVPATPDVLWATRMLAPHESATIEFTAPRQPGDYPYICTFPGHWRLMQGVMRVVE